MRSFTASVIIASSVIAAVLFVACGASVSQSEETTSGSCDAELSAHSFDLTSHLSLTEDAPRRDPIVLRYEISGEDYRVETDINVGLVESVSIGGRAIYRRYPNGDWFVYWDSAKRPLEFPFRLDSICPDLTGFTFKGEELLNGATLRRFAKPSVRYNFTAGPRTVEAWEYLVDSEGKLVRAINTTETGNNNGVLVQTVDFSGFGEPNAIVDPFPSGTPIPTSTPTPAFALAQVEAVQATVTPTPTPTSTPVVTPTLTPTVTPTHTPTPIPRISNLLPENRSEIEMRVGETVTLTVNVYDLQYQLDNSLADDVTFDWSSSEAGKFREADINSNDDGLPNDRSVVMTARNIGYHLVVAQLQPWECVGRCATDIRIIIRR